jgi:hypothetical protein
MDPPAKHYKCVRVQMFILGIGNDGLETLGISSFFVFKPWGHASFAIVKLTQ